MSSERAYATDLRFLGKKFVVRLSVIVLAAIVVIGSLTWSGYNQAIRDAEFETRTYAAILSARLDASLRRIDADLWELARTIPVPALSKAAIPSYASWLNPELSLRLLNFEEMASYGVADAYGDMLYTSRSASTPRTNVSDRDYFRWLQGHRHGETIFSEVHIEKSNNRTVIVIARRLMDGYGNFAGIVYGQLDLERFEALLQSLDLGTRSVVSWRRSDDHTLVLRSPYLETQGNTRLDPQHPLRKQMASGDSAATLQFAGQVDRIQRIYSYQALERYPFYVSVAQRRDDVLADWRARSMTIGGLTLLMVASLIWLLVQHSRSIQREAKVAGALRESERFTRAALDALTSRIVVLNTDGRIIATNRRWREFAQQKGQFSERVNEGANYLGICQSVVGMDDEAATTVATLIRDLIAGHRVEGEFEYRFDMPLEKRWFICRCTRFAGEGPVNVVISHREITARKQAEEERRDSERARLQIATIVDNSNDAIIGRNLDRKIVIWNRAAERLLGWTAAEAIGQDLCQLIPPEDQPRVAPNRQRVAEGNTVSYESTRLTKDGRRVEVSIGVSPIKDEDGNTIGTATSYRDLTERKRAEERLRVLNQELEAKVVARTADLERANQALAMQEEEARAVINNIADCVIIIDENGIIRAGNPMVEKIFGYAPEEVIGHNVSMLMPEPHRAAHDGYLEGYCRTGQAKIIGVGREVEGLQKSGERIALDLAISEYFVHGRRFFAGILRDIRERVSFRARLEEARRIAEDASRAKSDFLATMSHEIRTPMNGVIGMIDVLHQTGLTGDQKEMVDVIRDSAFSLLGIIEDVLDFAKIEAGRMEIERTSTSVSVIVEQVCNMLDNLAATKGVELTLFTDPAIPGEVLGDALRLRQVLTNLVNNAIKFSSGVERRGKVSMRARLVEQNLERVTVEFQVTDNGIGMDEQTQSGLFTSFNQADVSTTRRFGGTGLGLAIAKHLTTLMGGEITVHSAPDKGATFTLRLPFVPAPAKSGADIVVSEVAGLSCLVVGNVGGLADDLAVYLAHGGAAVERAPDLAVVMGRGAAHSSALLLIVVVDTDDTSHPPSQAYPALRERWGPEPRFLVIERGQRRKPRIAAPNLTKLDGNNLSREAFLKAVAIAAGRVRAETGAGTPSSRKTETQATPPSREDARRQGQLILVAEDNEVNQKVIRRQLGLLGFSADFARDGVEALNQWRSADYGMLLTDLHMPLMDGYRLAATIRAEEVGTPSRLPIVAVSANAVKDEIAHCQSVGMDDYVTKPLTLSNLKAMLTKWLPHAFETAPNSTDLRTVAAPSQTAAAPVDVRVLEGLVGDDAAVVSEFLQDFRISAAKIAAEVKAACQAAQVAPARAHAHKLKSSARSVGALALGELCADIERAGTVGDDQLLAELLPRFEVEMAAVDRYLASL